MSVFPRNQNPIYDLELRDKKGNIFGLKLDGSISSMQEIPSSPSTMVISSGGERYGDFEPGHSHVDQRSWGGGRGVEEFDDDNTGFFDSLNAYTWDDGKLYNGAQWQFAIGLRNAETFLPGSVTWKPLVSTQKFIATSFVASASYDSDKGYLWIRKRGTPGDITFKLCADNAGSPGTVLATVTKSTADITDTLSVYQAFDWTGVVALTASTTYWVTVGGSAADGSACHWEVAVDSASSGAKISSDGSTWSSGSFKMYYRIVDADTSRRFWYAELEGALYAVCKYEDGTASKLFINGARGTATSGAASTLTNTGASFGTASKFVGAKVKIIAGTGNGQERTITAHDNTILTVSPNFKKIPDNTSRYVVYNTPYWTEITSTGLGDVTGRPCIASKYMFFPQGSGTNIRYMRNNGTSHDFRADGSNNKADLLYLHYGDGVPKVYRAQNDLTDVTTSKSSVPAWASNFSFDTAKSVGSPDYLINNMVDVNGALWAFKEDSIWVEGGGTFTRLNLGLGYCTSDTNGIASITSGLVTYLSWLDSIEYYNAGTAADFGPWRLGGIPAGRCGNISCMTAVLSWLVCGIDAHDGTSSVLINTDVSGAVGGWHEIVRGFEAGKRIQDIYYQTNKNARGKLWIDIGGEMIYVEYPYMTFNPLLDSGYGYQHESAVVSPTIDFNFADLPKFYKELVVISENMEPGMVISVDYQVDENVNTDNWIHAGDIYNSPKESVNINEGGRKLFRYRLRLNTNNRLKTPIVKTTVLKGFARTPVKRQWNLRVVSAEDRKSNKKFYDWLWQNSQEADGVLMHSDLSDIDDTWVVVEPPSVMRESKDALADSWQGYYVLTVREA